MRRLRCWQGWLLLLLGLSLLVPAMAAGRLSHIAQTGVLEVCIWPDYYSISYRDPRSHQLSGIDVDLARELAQALAVELRFVDSSFDRLVEDLQRGRCDVAMFAIGITAERQRQLRFTRPHLASDVVAITTRSNRRIQRWEDIDQPGVVVAVAKGTWHEPLMRAELRHARLITPSTPRARELAVQSGRADVFLSDFPYSLKMLATTDWARRIEPAAPYRITPYGWALAPGDDDWHARLEQFMAAIKADGRLRAAARRHGLEPIVQEQ